MRTKEMMCVFKSGINYLVKQLIVFILINEIFRLSIINKINHPLIGTHILVSTGILYF